MKTNRVDFFKSVLRPGEGGWASREIPEDRRGFVSTSDVIAMLSANLSGELSDDELLDWTNLVLFNDGFDFDGKALRDVLDRIEESDEPDCAMGKRDIEAMIDALNRQ